MIYQSLRLLMAVISLTSAAIPTAAVYGATPSISLGALHSCAINSIGATFCWGDNNSGQLGDGTVGAAVKLDVLTLASGVIAVDAGLAHSCALTSAGGVKCWGSNDFGELGDGTTAARLIPADVRGLLSGVSMISVGDQFACALTTGRSVKCWGANFGNLGDGTRGNRSAPVDVIGLSNGATRVAAGARHACAITLSGGVKCWGENESGQLGDGTTTLRQAPVDVIGLASGVVAIAAGGSVTCAVLNSGGVKCWGANGFGQIGNGGIADRTTPTDVLALGGSAISVAVSGQAACAVMNTGGVKCWSRAYPFNSALPRDIGGSIAGVTDIAAGGLHFCVIGAQGNMGCFGPNNAFGELGNGSTRNAGLPVAVVGLNSAVRALGLGSQHTCAVEMSGGVRCWGNNLNGQLGNLTGKRNNIAGQVSGVTGAVAISTGNFYSCALTTAGGVKCWGANEVGQLGDGTTTDRGTPTDVVGLGPGVKAISAGGLLACALTGASGVKCWGSSNINNTLPVDIAGLQSGVISVSAGNQHACAVLVSRSVRCWGNNEFGQLGNGQTSSTSTPVDVSGLVGNVAAIAAGAQHTCALILNGEIKCWGANNVGQLGNGTNTNSSVPVDVSSFARGVRSLAAGIDSTCALTTTGGVSCWGRGASSDNKILPKSAANLSSSVVAISTGLAHACALIDGGGVLCYGDNQFGQLGDGSRVQNRNRVETVIGPNGKIFLDLTPEDPLPEGLTSPFVAISSGAGSNLTTEIQYRPQDIGKTGGVYVFAMAPASMVKNVSAEALANHKGPYTQSTNTADTPLPCVLAQLTASGDLTAASSGALQSYLTGVLSSQGASVSVLNGVSTALLSGAVFYVGYGTTSTTMLNGGTNKSVVTVPGAQTCQPQAPQTGWWWYPAQDGRGFGLEVRGNTMFMSGYLYDDTGHATWVVAAGPTALDGSFFNNTLYHVSNGQTLTGDYKAPAPVTFDGPITLSFTDARTGTLIWPGGSIPIQRFDDVIGSGNGVTPAFVPENGWWWNEAESGRGYFIEFKNNFAFIAGYMYEADGRPVWYTAQSTMASPQTFSSNWLQVANGQTMTGPYKKPVIINSNVGPVTIQFSDAANAMLTLPTGRQVAITRHRF